MHVENGSLGGGDSKEIKRLALSGTFGTWGKRPKSENMTRSLFFRGWKDRGLGIGLTFAVAIGLWLMASC